MRNHRYEYHALRRAFRLAMLTKEAGTIAFNELHATCPDAFVMLPQVMLNAQPVRMFGVQAARHAEAEGHSFKTALRLNIGFARLRRRKPVFG